MENHSWQRVSLSLTLGSIGNNTQEEKLNNNTVHLREVFKTIYVTPTADRNKNERKIVINN